ncbi:MAG: pyrroline-5-carboxylate reductase [Fimbriimonadaceae bacterium]|nr:pyrroline-5-carboxylate reductase [Alphaproteobacteria bacterium]
MSLKTSGELVLIGAGKMGGAMLEGWLARGYPAKNIHIQDPGATAALTALAAEKGMSLNAPLENLPDPDVVLLAVKPQMMDDVLRSLGPLMRPGVVFLSIAAGKTIDGMTTPLREAAGDNGGDLAIVRSIPNTPAAVGRGITVACANANVSAAQKDLCTALLEAIGEVAWVEDESLIDAVTAVSGSGPAYVFYLTECMAKAGVAVGLPETLAARLARATVAGAGELMRQSDLDPATLRQNVTSPGGTTAAALTVLMADNGMEPLLRTAITAAEKRSRELS